MKEIDEIREALTTIVIYDTEYKCDLTTHEPDYEHPTNGDCGTLAKKALASLDRLEAMLKPSKDSRKLGEHISAILGVSRPQISGDPGNDPALDAVVDTITAYVNAKLQEAAERIAELEGDSVRLSRTIETASLRLECIAAQIETTQSDNIVEKIDETIKLLDAALASRPEENPADMAQREADKRAYKWRHDMMGDDEEKETEL